MGSALLFMPQQQQQQQQLNTHLLDLQGTSAGTAPLPWLSGGSIGLLPSAAAAANAGGQGFQLMGASASYTGVQLEGQGGPPSQWVDFGPEGGLVLVEKPPPAMLHSSAAVVPEAGPLLPGLLPSGAEALGGSGLFWEATAPPDK
jgi:hypothetical protein